MKCMNIKGAESVYQREQSEALEKEKTILHCHEIKAKDTRDIGKQLCDFCPNEAEIVDNIKAVSVSLKSHEINFKVVLSSEEFIFLLEAEDCSFDDDIEYIVTSNLKIAHNQNIRQLPKNLIVEGDFEIINCNMLEKFSSFLIVDGDLKLHYCSKLTKLAENLNVINGYFDVNACSALEKLPSFQEVSGGFRLRNCPKIREFPEDIKNVNGNFIIEDSDVL